ncbi:hypothetical protein TELCIR_01704 [Teladorsagia circumcincta]|uniref:Legumain prodomain domain-containing protein n=1 Tax=Teladorsagia circumcincta TaxID=45464 RepID=A0A2G9V172_TELCI|nr:hypothetical protein TELCIR_01704 [Teladorsagia circumcincta]
MHYGNLSMGKEPVGWFQGAGNSKRTMRKTPSESQEERVSWPSRDVELMHLQMKKLLSPQSAAVDTEISRIQKYRHNIEAVFTSLINHLVRDGSERRRLFEKRSDVENLDCHDDVVRIFDMICIDFNKYDYALKYVYVLNNLCTKFNDSAKIIEAMWTTCSKTRSKFF